MKPTASALLAVTLVIIAGCSLKKAAPEKHTFIVEAARSGDRPAVRRGTGNPAGVNLRIRGWQVAPAFDGRNFVYRQGNLNYASDFYNEFLVPPRMLFAEQSRRWLANSGAFSAVTDNSSHVEPTLVLEGAVTELYGDYRETAAPKAVLAVQVTALNPRATIPGTGTLLQKEYRREMEIPKANPGALADGWSRALTEILQALEADLIKLRVP